MLDSVSGNVEKTLGTLSEGVVSLANGFCVAILEFGKASLNAFDRSLYLSEWYR